MYCKIHVLTLEPQDFFEILILKLTTKTFIEVLLDKEEQKFNDRYKNIINSVADLMSFCMG